MKGIPDPLNVPAECSPPPPGVSPAYWQRITRWCAALDARANHGAGPERKADQ